MTARRILLRMVRPGEGLEVTSSRIRRVSLDRIGEDPGRIDRVLEKLIAARLVRLTEGDAPEDAQVEVAHEALVRNWPTLVTWLEEERETLRRRQRLASAAAQWEALDHDAGALLRGAALDEALRYDDLSDHETAFVQASQAALKAEQERETEQRVELATVRARAEVEARANKRARRLLSVIVLLAIVAGLAAILALYQAARAVAASGEAVNKAADLQTAVANGSTANAIALQNAQVADGNRQVAESNAQVAQANIATAQAAEEIANNLRDKEAQRRRAERADLLAALAQAVMPGQPQLSLLLGVESYHVQHDEQPPEVPEPSVLRSLTQTLVRLGAPTRGLPGHSGKITAVTISADGKQLLTGGTDATARLWDLTATNPTTNSLQLSGITAPVSHVAITPDGNRLLVAGDDGIVHIWSRADIAAKPHDLLGLKGPIRSFAISANGRWLGVGGSDAVAFVWDLTNLNAPPLKLQHQLPITSMAIGTNNQVVLTSSADGTASLWDLTSQNPERANALLAPRQGTPGLATAALSPDGRWAAIAGEDGAEHVWRLAGASFSNGPVVLRTGSISALAIDPKNRWVVTGGVEGTIQLWLLGNDRPQFTLSGHIQRITGLVFSADGSRMASVSADGTVRVWDLSAADPSVGPHVLRGHEGRINAAALSGDGARLATGGDDSIARDWDLLAPSPSANTLPQDPTALAQIACQAAGRELSPEEWAEYFPDQPLRKTCDR